RAWRRARPRRAPATDLHAVRAPLVRVLPAAVAGEPEARGLHRGRHRRSLLARAQRVLALQHAAAEGDPYGVGPGAGAELVVDVLDVGADRAAADDQVLGHLGRGQAV